MAAERRPRRGFALFAIVVGMVVIAILATLMLTPTAGGDNQNARIQRTADILHRLVAEMDSASGAMPSYFRQYVRATAGSSNSQPKWPGKLSHLYTAPASSEPRCQGGSYSAGGVSVANWRGPFHTVPIKPGGHQITPGFFADDNIVRISNTSAYIQIQNVSLDDAKALDLVVDKTSNASSGAVQWTPTTGVTPVIVQYRFTSTAANNTAPCA